MANDDKAGGERCPECDRAVVESMEAFWKNPSYSCPKDVSRGDCNDSDWLYLNCAYATITRLRAELEAAKRENEAWKQLAGWEAWEHERRAVHIDGPFLVAYQGNVQLGAVPIECGDGYGNAAIDLATKLGLTKPSEGQGT